jgi:hypothetical protein
VSWVRVRVASFGSTTVYRVYYRRGSSPGQLETVRYAQRRTRLHHLCAALWLGDPLRVPLGKRLANCPSGRDVLVRDGWPEGSAGLALAAPPGRSCESAFL